MTRVSVCGYADTVKPSRSNSAASWPARHVERDLADLEARGQGADLVGDLEDR